MTTPNALTRCLFCSKPLDGSDEHIILNAIGGRRSSRRLVCSATNHEFGDTIDKEFLAALDFITLIIQPPTRRRSNGATKRVLDEHGVEYDMVAGGHIKVRYKEVAQNQWVADISQADLLRENVKRKAESIEAKTGQTTQISEATGSEMPGRLRFQIQLDQFTAMRQFLKWVIELLGAEVLMTDELRGDVLTLERNFVADASKLPPKGGFLDQTHVPHLFSGLDHYVLVVRSEDGTAYWEASAYGGALAAAGRTGVIPVSFDPLLYVVDPVTGDQSLERPTIAILADRCKWLPTYAPVCEARTVAAVGRMEQHMNDRIAQDQMFQECWAECVPAAATVLEQAHVNALSRCVAERFVAWARATTGRELRTPGT